MSETKWQFYLRSSDAWEAMLADCEQAKSSIDIEQYIFGEDEIGHRFFEVLRKKNKEGVKIRLLCDAAGSFDLMGSLTAEQLIKEGIEIKFFNPIKPWRIPNFSSWFLRDHRKLLIVDGKIGQTGGVGIEKRMEHWRDTHIRIEGPVVEEMQYVFNRMWAMAPKRKFFRMKRKALVSEDFNFLTNAPRFGGRFIYHDLLRAIKSARHYAYFTTPYFVPSIRLFMALRKAAKRGVDVRLLLPAASDVRIADIAAGSYFLLALKAGIKIYLYDHKKILHAKTAVIDGEWGSVGSANLDSLSLLLNFEGNIVSSDQNFIAELKNQFLADLNSSTEVTFARWIKRPFFRKVLEFLTWPIHQIL